MPDPLLNSVSFSDIPRFELTLGADQSISDSVETKLDFSVVGTSIGFQIDTSNDRAYVLRGGTYIIGSHYGYTGSDGTGHLWDNRLFKNGSQIALTANREVADTTAKQQGGIWRLSFAPGDYLEMFVYSSGTAVTVKKDAGTLSAAEWQAARFFGFLVAE